MSISSRTVVEAVAGILGVFAALFGWRAIDTAVAASDGGWLLPIGWFSLLAIAFFLSAILCDRRLVRAVIAIAIPASSLLFVPIFPHLAFVVFAAFSLYAASDAIRIDMESRVFFSFRKSMGAGAFLLILPMSILVASQYYTDIHASSWHDLVPRFSLAEGGGDFVLRTAGMFSPDIARIRDDRMTVDTFLATTRDAESYPVPVGTILPDTIIRTIAIETGRMELGKLVGRELQGTERMADVLSEALRNKTIAFLSGTKAERSLPNGALPFFLAMLLFVTVFSVASLLRGVWTLLAALLLRFLLYSRVLSVGKLPTERDIIR